MKYDSIVGRTKTAPVFDRGRLTQGMSARIRAGIHPDSLSNMDPGHIDPTNEGQRLHEELNELDPKHKWINCLICGFGDSITLTRIEVIFINGTERYLRWIHVNDILSGVIEMEVASDSQ